MSQSFKNKIFKQIRLSPVFLFLGFIFLSCSKDEPVELEFSEHQETVISYFKEIALGFEFGNASKITRKWKTNMQIFVGGEKNQSLMNELNAIITEINDLASDGFTMSITQDSLNSNYYIFFGSSTDYGKLFPSSASLAESNWGLFNVYWNSNQQLNRGRMYVDIVRADLTEQKHLLREELTQSLGLARDSNRFSDSIFQQSWTRTNEYAEIDKDLIRLLYHQEMKVGLNETAVDPVLRKLVKDIPI
ncbi:DUF2927 domain-containing protein [Fulvivirgaceae bacterium BMA10]|uniref:DUF2927 domain-containing protein n=1 Tax=Splendidivirga corallicola TaxID=3051826 RepID=A0ABT8KRB2_9BACT|nr:DUF2927 domain-containing protein [Fulvivirgaceae bacterium BMA10]